VTGGCARDCRTTRRGETLRGLVFTGASDPR